MAFNLVGGKEISATLTPKDLKLEKKDKTGRKWLEFKLNIWKEQAGLFALEGVCVLIVLASLTLFGFLFVLPVAGWLCLKQQEKLWKATRDFRRFSSKDTIIVDLK
jgi:hypothetical protein